MGFTKMTVRDAPLYGKTVLVRADYNVPLAHNGDTITIHDDYRIAMSLPTIQYLREQNCTVVICAHLGRPDGAPKPELSLEPIAQRLADFLHAPVHFVPATIGDTVTQTIKSLPHGSVVLLENLRFHPEEEANDEQFARALARDSTADYFVQDGFGVVHRAHASTDAVTHYLPSVAGLLVERECTILDKVAHHPARPFAVVLGGAKISDKIGLVQDFVKKADKVVIGGAMANNFLAWAGYPIGASKFDEDASKIVDGIMEVICGDQHDHKMCVGSNKKLLLPVDVAVTKQITDDMSQAKRVVKTLDAVADDDIIVDLGDASIAALPGFLDGSKTVLWNGTLGYAEAPAFANGSAALAQWLADNRLKLESVVGGGDTADFVLKWDTKKHGASFTHVSTGGGASLELLSGEKLPGIEALLNKSKHPSIDKKASHTVH